MRAVSRASPLLKVGWPARLARLYVDRESNRMHLHLCSIWKLEKLVSSISVLALAAMYKCYVLESGSYMHPDSQQSTLQSQISAVSASYWVCMSIVLQRAKKIALAS